MRSLPVFFGNLDGEVNALLLDSTHKKKILTFLLFKNIIFNPYAVVNVKAFIFTVFFQN